MPAPGPGSPSLDDLVLVRVWLSMFADPNIATAAAPRCGQMSFV
jgi:hypothetical protein